MMTQRLLVQGLLGITTFSRRAPILFPVGKRIAAGIRYADEFVPREWRNMVDGNIINIRVGCSCFVGQIFGDYRYGCYELGLDPDTGVPAMLGFNALDPKGPHAEQEFEALTRGWRVALQTPTIRSLKRLKIAA